MAPFTIEYVLVLIGAFLLSLFLTPIVRFIAFRVGAVDNPNARRVNEVPMPSSGGLAIFISFLISLAMSTANGMYFSLNSNAKSFERADMDNILF